MSSFSKIPSKWELNHFEKCFVLHSMNDAISNFTLALQVEDISTLEKNLKFLDAAVKQLSKNQLAKNLAKNPLFI